MALNLYNPALYSDHGATSSSTSTSVITSTPDVNFSGFSLTEFKSSSYNIGCTINSIKSSWKQLDKALKRIGTPKDTQEFREKIHNLQTQTNIQIQTSSKDLQRLTAVVRHADKQEKLKLEKLTNEFRQVVEIYSESQQKIAKAMKNVLLSVRTSQQQEGECATNMRDDQLIQIQQQTEASLLFEQNMLLDQERRIKEIESTLRDVNSIFGVLSILVQEQGNQVDRIETTTDTAHAALKDGAGELKIAGKYAASYRRKMLILLGIAVIIGLIVTAIIVGK